MYDWEPEKWPWRFSRSPITSARKRDQASGPVLAIAMVAGYEAVLDSGLDFSQEMLTAAA